MAAFVRRVFRRKVGKTVNGKNVYRGLRGGYFTHNKNGKNSTVYQIGNVFSTNPNYVPNISLAYTYIK